MVAIVIEKFSFITMYLNSIIHVYITICTPIRTNLIPNNKCKDTLSANRKKKRVHFLISNDCV